MLVLDEDSVLPTVRKCLLLDRFNSSLELYEAELDELLLLELEDAEPDENINTALNSACSAAVDIGSSMRGVSMLALNTTSFGC